MEVVHQMNTEQLHSVPLKERVTDPGYKVHVVDVYHATIVRSGLLKQLVIGCVPRTAGKLHKEVDKLIEH